MAGEWSIPPWLIWSGESPSFWERLRWRERWQVYYLARNREGPPPPGSLAYSDAQTAAALAGYGI